MSSKDQDSDNMMSNQTIFLQWDSFSLTSFYLPAQDNFSILTVNTRGKRCVMSYQRRIYWPKQKYIWTLALNEEWQKGLLETVQSPHSHKKRGALSTHCSETFRTYCIYLMDFIQRKNDLFNIVQLLLTVLAIFSTGWGKNDLEGKIP